MDAPVTQKKKKKGWRIALDIAMYVVIVVAVVFGLPKLLVAALGTNYPMAAITSGSMWPVLKQGDLVFIQAVPTSDIRVGDIVVYRNRANNTLTIHRVVKIDASTVTTKGDANFEPDASASLTDIIGRSVVLWNHPVRIPYLGFITEFAGKLRASSQIDIR